MSTSSAVRVGSGEFTYEADNAFGDLPDGWSFIEAVGAATDSRDRVYVFNRGTHPIIVFDRDGKFLSAWGEGRFVRPHGIWIGPDDSLYLTDDMDHTVGKYTPDGELIWKIGTSGRGSDSGVQNSDYRTIVRGAPPFNQPTNLALAPTGEMYISDGYGNARVHKYSADGKLLTSWGEPGTKPGEFNVPHGIIVDPRGRVLVADRENSRLQIFSPDGEYLEEWTEPRRPCDMFIDKQNRLYIAELGFRAGMANPDPNGPGPRIGIYDLDGHLLAAWGDGGRAGVPGEFTAPHDIWVDSRGSIYLSEVVVSAAISKGLAPEGTPSLSKFNRVAK
jgi:DNA-binding beta-propeller fold protein YncE